jgi:putative hemolysin
MFTVLLIALLVMAPLLVLVTLMQTLYMESVRVRPKDAAFLGLFRERISDRIGLKADDGILTFSLVKHTTLTLLGVAVLAAASDGPLQWLDVLEGAALSCVAMVLCSYIVPQIIYRRTEGRWFLPLVPLMYALTVVVRPVVGLLAFLQSLAELGQKDEALADTGTPEENIDALITAGAEEGIIEENDRKLIQSVVAFGDKTVREVMTPRPAMVTISADATLEDLRQLVIHEQFSRIPVFRENIDDIIGFVHVRDMFELDHTERVSRTVSELVRPLPQVPETKSVWSPWRTWSRRSWAKSATSMSPAMTWNLTRTAGTSSAAVSIWITSTTCCSSGRWSTSSRQRWAGLSPNGWAMCRPAGKAWNGKAFVSKCCPPTICAWNRCGSRA